jgi:hypothetical protein
MRLPYLQVTQETWDNARVLAILLGITEAAAFKLQCDLWRWGLALGSDDEPPTGICTSPRADVLLAAAVGWTADNVSVLVAALVDVGLVVSMPDGLRVRGMDRYRRTWEKNRRRPARTVPETGTKTPVTGTNPAPPAPEPARQTQTQTQTQKKESFAGSADAAPAPKKPKPEKQPDPRHAPLRQALMDDTPGYTFTPRDAKAIAELLELGTPEEIRARWRRAREHRGFPNVRTLPELAKHWNHFPTEQTRPLRPGEEERCVLLR